jgi:hypothetical protein
MLRRLKALLAAGVCVLSVPAAASETNPDDSASTGADAEVEAGAKGEAVEAAPGSDAVKPAEPAPGWQTFVTGYFRAPLAIGLSPRRGPNDPDGPKNQQASYGPTRTVDASNYSFAYTRLQEQDWAEVFIHAKQEHMEAVVGWMGYWYQAAGFRNYDAGWVPGMAYLTLDTDFELAAMTPNIALTVGAWWPKFGTFAKYDTYTLGAFHQVGEQLKLTLPLSSDLKLTVLQGFGGGRDGSFSILAPPPYQAIVGLILLHYENVQLSYGKHVDVSLHYNHEWTRDPNLTQQGVPGKSYDDAATASLTTVGGELNLSAPYAGRLWISPSYIRVKNGWALAQAGIEVMHSLSADGLATNYLGWSNSPADSTGSGSLFSLGFLYENTLSGIQGRTPGSALPEVTLNVFGLMANAKLDLPSGSTLPQDEIKQLKYGADVEVQPLDWLKLMLRYDQVIYDLENDGYVFSAITPRATFSARFLSGANIYIQYSRYRYGDKMTLAGKWPWGTPLVAGSNIIQGGTYADHKPDMDVVKIQANVNF